MAVSQGDILEAEQWAVAARMLEVHGDEIGAALLARIQSLLEAGDQVEVQNWLEITEKVQQMYAPEGNT